jgi:hypothetical protein
VSRRGARFADSRTPRRRPSRGLVVFERVLAGDVLASLQTICTRALERSRRLRFWIRASGRGAAQPIHRDRRDPDGFSVDFALTDLTCENGATEVWLGSHRIVDADGASIRATASRAAEQTSTRLLMPAGSVAVRDLRLWHRAMPNQTAEDRVILSITMEGPAA